MTILQLYKIAKAYGGHTVLTDISLSVNEGDRIAVIGSNGSGKTTLLRCITGQIEPDSGKAIKKTNLNIGYLEQISKLSTDMLVWDAIMLSFTETLQIRRQMRHMEKQMAFLNGNELQSLMDDYARKVEIYEIANGYECESRAKKVLLGLGFDEHDFYKPLGSFSGGVKTRLHLAQLLAGEPELLLLDEPTNHLDMPAVEWLEDYLSNYPGTVMIVSHDRMFLDKVVDHVAEIKGGKLQCFAGNYSAFVLKREASEVASRKAFNQQQERIEKAEAFIRRYMAGVKSKQARGRKAQLERMQRLESPVQSRVLGSKTIQIKGKTGQVVIELFSVSKSYEGKSILDQLDLQIRKGEKIALIGANGTGKTTLVKIVSGVINVDEGSVNLGSQVEIGYFSQEHEDLGKDRTVLEEITDNFSLTLEEARTSLGSMLFCGDDVFKKIDNLSGGEQGRLALLKLILAGANFLVLDEPTNHLDLDSRQVIADMLRDYPGTILFVSHDRYFIDYFADRIWALEQGKINIYHGNYSHYQEKMLFRQKEVMPVETTQDQNISRGQQFRLQQKEQQKIRRRLLRAIADLEEDITALEGKKEEIEKLLSELATYQDDDLAKELPQEYQEVLLRLDNYILEWEELNHMLSGIGEDEIMNS